VTAFLRTNAVFLTLVGCAGGIALMAVGSWPAQALGVALLIGGLLVPFLRLGVRPVGSGLAADYSSAFEIPIKELGLDNQTLIILEENHIFTVGHLLVRDPQDILDMEGIDPYRLTGIRKALVRAGILPSFEGMDGEVVIEDEDEEASTVEAVMRWLREQPTVRA
jgi:hypothetical protein